ncbi:MAG: ABC transporter permease [Clostridiales bacterium]|nr:ABC transporter permease [Clostridiales bacterium]
MLAFLATFITGFKYLWRNPVSVTILIAFPIVIILILGNALSAYISVDTTLEPAAVAVAADENGQLAQFLQSGEIARFLAIEFTDEARAAELAAQGAVYAAIIERDGGITVLRPPGGSVMSHFALSAVDSYKQIGAAAAIAAMDGKDVSELLEMEISVRDMPLGKRVPSAMDYYAVTMLVMILLFTGMNGMELFNKGLLDETGLRIRLTPISKPALIGGLLSAAAATSFLQGMVTFLFTGLVYGVYWGERIPLVLLTLFAVVLFSQALCIFMIMLFRHQGAAVGVSQALFWVMTFVAKGYAKISFGEADKIFAYSPNALAHTVIFGAVYGGNENIMALDLALLFGLGLLLFMLAFVLGRRRLA